MRNTTNGLYLFLSLMALLLADSSAAFAQTKEPPQECIMGRPNLRDRYYAVVEGSNGREILDKTTNLIWQRCPLGTSWNGTTCIGQPETITWNQVAQNNPKPSENDWRVPTVQELQTLVDVNCSPSINLNFFPKTRRDLPFWTATVLPQPNYQGQAAYGVEFDRGTAVIMLKIHPAAFRAVRGIFKYSNDPK